MSINTLNQLFYDDFTMRNYLALYACIFNPKLTVSESLRIFKITTRD